MNDKQKELIKQIKENHQKKKQARKEQWEQDAKQHQEKKTEKKKDRELNKTYYKETKQKIKELKIERKQTINNLSKEIDKQEYKLKKQVIYDEYNEKIVALKNNILDRKFEFGKKYRTLNWKLLKWMYGVRKEFNRVYWSSPRNTFKYLAIIVVIVLFLSAIFIAIDAIVSTFN